MRVITGIARGQKLAEPLNYDVRPTADRVKEAMFNIIQGDEEGRCCLDLFAGTGQLGIEALSRGAASCVFVDEASAAVRLVKANLEKTSLNGGTVLQTDALKYIENCGKFDLIFIDPPYASGFCEKALKAITKFDKLNPGGIIICETAADNEPGQLDEPYRKLRTYRYGKVRLTTYSKTQRG